MEGCGILAYHNHLSFELMLLYPDVERDLGYFSCGKIEIRKRRIVKKNDWRSENSLIYMLYIFLVVFIES